MDTELAECNFISEVDLTRSAGGSGTAPVGPWRQQSRLSNRSIDDQIAYVLCIIAIDDSEKTEEVERCDKEVRDADAELVAHRQRLRRLRDDYRATGVSKTQAETAKDRAIQEAEELREKLQNQQPDSGRIIAYEETIAVYSFNLVSYKRKRKGRRKSS